MDTKTKTRVKVRERIKLAADLAMGTVSINAKDLNKMKNFYHEVCGFDILEVDENKIIIGKDNNPLLEIHKSDLPFSNRNEAGLYHFAVVFSQRSELAKTIFRIISKSPESFSGSADHLVSEAFYFTDPEGNGMELYFDRERKDWTWENGQIKMATLYIDLAGYVKTYGRLNETDNIIKMGHVHLKVGNIEMARGFYINILGFEVTAELPGALFVSAGGYHHHLGINTWESGGAKIRKESLGLKSFEINLKNYGDFESIKERLRENGIRFYESDNSITFPDPWNNRITVIIS